MLAASPPHTDLGGHVTGQQTTGSAATPAGSRYFSPRRQWWVIALCLVGGLVPSWLYTVNATPRYQSSTQLLFHGRLVEDALRAESSANVGKSDPVTGLTQAGALTQAKMPTYAQLVTSSQVLGPVIASANLRVTEHELRDRITVQTTVAANTMVVSIVDDDAAQAYRTVTGIAQTLPLVVGELENVNGESPVEILVLRPATQATLPSWPRLDLNLAVGLMAGLVVGIGLALVRDQLDSRIRGEQQVFEATGIGLLSAVPRAGRRVRDTQLDQRAEALSRLRFNLGYGSRRGAPQVLLVASPRAHRGRIDLVPQLARSCGRAGMRVLVVDCDLRLGDLAGAQNLGTGPGVSDVLAGLADPAGATQRLQDSIDLVGAGHRPPNPSELLGSSNMVELIDVWREHYDVVILNGAPLLDTADSLALVPFVDGVICVVQDGVTRRNHLASALKMIATVQGHLCGIVLVDVAAPGADRRIDLREQPPQRVAS